MGPNPSPARAAAATAPFQSGSTPSWFAANVNASSPAANVTGSASTFANDRSSCAAACLDGSPPTSTPATYVPGASSCREPAKTRPTSSARTTRRPAPIKSVARAERPRARGRARGENSGDSARTEPEILPASRERPCHRACRPCAPPSIFTLSFAFRSTYVRTSPIESAVGGGLGCPDGHRSKHEQLDPARHVEPDAGDVCGEV